jgi:hypothetical protein
MMRFAGAVEQYSDDRPEIAAAFGRFKRNCKE